MSAPAEQERVEIPAPAEPSQVIDPTKRFFMAAQVTEAGRVDLIDFGHLVPEVGTDEDALIAACRANAKAFGGRYYIFEVIPVRRITKSTTKLIG